MSEQMDVLVVDKGGMPREWTGFEEEAARYYALGKVICDLGSPIHTFHGGKNSNGEQSKIVFSSIIMVDGPILGAKFMTRETIYAERKILYARDLLMCAYCGQVGKNINDKNLTIDHVHPQSRGGKHTWQNTVTSCRGCNHAKANRTPEEWGTPLLYVPYAPNLQEKLLLKNRKVKADQMEYLLANIPKTSRAWQLNKLN